MKHRIGLGLVLGVTLISGTSRAELVPSVCGIGSFDIVWSNVVVGYVVVVAEDNTNPPAGYTAGYEYWTWTSGPPWRGAFKLQPTGGNPPTYGNYTWKVFPHEHFDLSDTIPFPSISPGANDGFGEVSVGSGSSWDTQGYMWLKAGSPPTQEWYGVDLTADLIDSGTGNIRFVSVEVPTASSVDVYLLE